MLQVNIIATEDLGRAKHAESHGTDHLQKLLDVLPTPSRQRRLVSTSSIASKCTPSYVTSRDPEAGLRRARQASHESSRREFSAKRIGDDDSVTILQATLASCEMELRLLNARVCEFVGQPRVHLSLQQEVFEGWKITLNTFGCRLEALAADALERACTLEECNAHREELEAVEVFNAANAAIDQIAILLNACKDAQVEAESPASCDPSEWRIVVAHSTLKEQEALRNILTALKDCQAHIAAARQPATLLWFLRAQHGRDVAAKAMFRESMRWRARYQVPPLGFLEYGKRIDIGKSQYRLHTVIAKDRYGLPVYLCRWGASSIMDIERDVSTESFRCEMASVFEELISEIRRIMFQQNCLRPGCLCIWDFGRQRTSSNFFSRTLALGRLLVKLANVLHISYPEVIRKVMVVHGNAVTGMICQACCCGLAANALSKFKIYGSCPKSWASDLMEEIPEAAAMPALLTFDALQVPLDKC